jgi:hypothetical protein
MHVAKKSVGHSISRWPVRRKRSFPAPAAISDAKLSQMRVSALRAAIRRNQVSFPAQVPTFAKHDRPDVQHKLAQLYFIAGWNAAKIRARYALSGQRFHQIVRAWTRRAVELGYIQVIPSAKALVMPVRRLPLQVVFSRSADGAASVEVPSRKISRPLKPAADGSSSDARTRRKCDPSKQDTFGLRSGLAALAIGKMNPSHRNYGG